MAGPCCGRNMSGKSLHLRVLKVKTAERLKFEQVSTYAPIHMAGHERLGDFVFVPTGKHP